MAFGGVGGGLMLRSGDSPAVVVGKSAVAEKVTTCAALSFLVLDAVSGLIT